MPDSHPLRAGDPPRLGGYEIAGRLGEGGQGTVYLGRAASGASVAIKLLHPGLAGDGTARARFVREVEVAKRVARFCTAQVLEADVDGDRPYIVSEYVPGRSLHVIVQNDGPRTDGALERLAVGTLTALIAIHQAGIVHRDFKPHNVMMGPDGPRVIDFGVARALGAAGETQNVGTPAYMAPEHFTGDEVGPASDMFAWGSTMVFAANGWSPFGNDEMAAVMNRILTGEPDLGVLSEPLRGLVASCLAKDPALRPTARQAQERLVGGAVTPFAAPPPAPAPGAVPAPMLPPLPPFVPNLGPEPAPEPASGSTTPVPDGPVRRGRLVPVAAAVAVLTVVAGGAVWAATRPGSSGGGDGGTKNDRQAAAAEQAGNGGSAGLGGGEKDEKGRPKPKPQDQGKDENGKDKPGGKKKEEQPKGKDQGQDQKPAPGTTPPPAREPANKYTPQAVCNSGGHGGGYYVQRSVSGSGGTAYLLYNSSGYNCAVTLKTRNVGKRSPVSVWIQRSGGGQVGDSGSFEWYAGPVFVSAAKKCVRFGGNGAAAPYGNCG
ncbi:Serine/threonine-protein kinase PknD [Actinomadura sp. RB68]|uniref:Serine/threonine-protein kinase PknD n=2 Tax=Actinomadura macrotermitis TaxID=2585200 RepID=A0A7K0BSN6_9ACTN|nr:Serine/threonine-protein kinase PknD [Actinomadura macrotermitis]